MFQYFQGFLLASIAILAARSHTGGTTIHTLTVTDEFKRACQQFVVHLEQLLTEANPGRDRVVEDNGWLSKRLIFDWFEVRAQVACVAHQEQWRKVAEHVCQPGESAADADVLFHFAMTGMTE